LTDRRGGICCCGDVVEAKQRWREGREEGGQLASFEVSAREIVVERAMRGGGDEEYGWMEVVEAERKKGVV
jgi:hypothetical protein